MGTQSKRMGNMWWSSQVQGRAEQCSCLGGAELWWQPGSLHGYLATSSTRAVLQYHHSKCIRYKKNNNNLKKKKKIQKFAVIPVSNCNLENQAGASWEHTSARSRARGSKRRAASQPPKYHSRHTCDSKPAQSKGTNFKRHTVLFQVQPVHQRVIWLF